MITFIIRVMKTWAQIVYIADCMWLLLKISVFHHTCQQKHGIAMIHVQNVLFIGTLSLRVKTVECTERCQRSLFLSALSCNVQMETYYSNCIHLASKDTANFIHLIESYMDLKYVILIILRLQMIIQKIYFKHIKDHFAPCSSFHFKHIATRVNMGINSMLLAVWAILIFLVFFTCR